MCSAFQFSKTILTILALAGGLQGWLSEAPEATQAAPAKQTSANREGNMTNQADFKLNKIGVVMVGVKDFAQSVAFYRDTLGLPAQGEVPGEFAFFNGGGVTLALSSPHANPKTSPSVVGALEIVFSVDNVTAAHAALRARGVQFLHEPRHTTGDNWSAVFTDPNGHRLSIFGPKGQ